MGKRNIRLKIIFITGLFLFEVFLLTFLLFWAVRNYENSVKLSSTASGKIDAVKDLQIALAEVSMPVNDFLIAGSDRNEPKNFRTVSTRLERLFATLAKEKITVGAQVQVLADIQKKYFSGKKIAQKILNLPDAIREREGGALMENMDKEFSDALRQAEKLHEYALRGVSDAKKNYQKFSSLIAFLTLVIILFNLFFIAAIIIFFERAVIAPIFSLRSAALEVAAGNLDKKVEIYANNEIGELAALFNVMVEKRKMAQNELLNQNQTQEILNDILKISLENIPFAEVLKKTIERLFSIPWFSLERRGGIFLVEDNPQLLTLKAQAGLSSQIQEMCECVPFGKCLCGRAAASGKIEFADCLDERHESTYSNMPPHGHYCVPIVNVDKKRLGVINLYLKEGHKDSSRERELLTAIANILVGIIERRSAEELREKAYAELKSTQEQLIQSEKFRAIGKLASGIAHEVRNPLAIIMQSADYLANKLYENKDVGDVASMIKENIKRADNIICALVDFSRVTKLELESLDINLLIENSLLLIPHSFILENIEVVKAFSANLPPVTADKKKLTQVFINIFLNAIQAMPDGGSLFIRTYETKVTAPFYDKSKDGQVAFEAGENIVRIEIEDTGCGISPEHLKLIFDPFFTTRSSQQGTGLGLSVVKNIIQMHKGFIDVESQVQKGTKFIITLKGGGSVV
ncbi:MAG: ATP-binding protein [Candidatus Omnitrophica bacterium]|nr:ATP-binding protein [Candidatus Omnitrophota bacterium]